MAPCFLIETALPLKELSEEAWCEKAIRPGPPSTLHMWWARRPLVTARAAVLGALLTEEATTPERRRGCLQMERGRNKPRSIAVKTFN